MSLIGPGDLSPATVALTLLSARLSLETAALPATMPLRVMPGLENSI